MDTEVVKLTYKSAVAIAGCSSHGPIDVYLISLSYVDPTSPAAVHTHPSQVNQNISSTFSNLANTASLEVRVGYLGLCARQTAGKWQCLSSATFLASLVELGNPNSARDGDPLDLIWIASNFRDQVIFVGLMYVLNSLLQVSL